MVRIIIYIYIILLLNSCNGQEPYKTKIKNEIEINSGLIISNFTLIKVDQESAFGDYSEKYSIKFDSKNLDEIIYQIEHSKYYDSSFKYNHSETIMINSTKKRWVKMPFGYKFLYFIKGSEKMVQYEINISKFTIDCMYIEE
ncbi:MAG: hypothetical protein WCJ62_10115 [Flavobacterium sp.]